MHEINEYISGEWILLQFFCGYALIITTATEDSAGNQISFNIIVINSPEKVKNSFEQSNVSIEKI